MSQEFIIKSPSLEDKINELLPSQGGFQAGVDLSASTQIIPIVDLTEAASGAGQRQDLQTALSLNSCTVVNVVGATTTLANTPGYYRLTAFFNSNSGGNASIRVTDGFTTKVLFTANALTVATTDNFVDIIIFIKAGESIVGFSNGVNASITGNTRQIADVNGNLTKTL